MTDPVNKLTTPIAPADVSSATDFQGLARLKAEAGAQSPEALKKVAQQFESLFMEMMLKSMRDASLGEGIFDNDQSQMYMSLFDKQISMQMAKGEGKGLGIAAMLMRQMGGAGSTAAAPSATKDAPSLTLPRSAGEGREGAAAAQWKPTSPADFVREVLPHAQKAAAQLNVDPLALVAQAAVETGWGQHMIAGNDGSNSMNLFGIKAGESWNGEKSVARTIEFKDGLPFAQQAAFRRYGSISESFSDYANLLSSSPRYREALEQGRDPQGFIEALGRSGYATDPSYAQKIKGVLGGETFRQAVQDAVTALKAGGSGPIV